MSEKTFDNPNILRARHATPSSARIEALAQNQKCYGTRRFAEHVRPPAQRSTPPCSEVLALQW
eukprot:3838316-Amphidinium_carterae.1